MTRILKDGGRKDEQELFEVFSAFDRHSKGYITREDMAVLFSRLGQHFSTEDVNQMALAADLNRDRKITFEGQFSRNLYMQTRIYYHHWI